MTQTRRRLSVEERSEELLAFGQQHFAVHAFDALPVDEIARQAGVSKGLIYRYFGGRRGFYIATIERVVDEIISAFTPRPEDPLALSSMLNSFLDYAESNSGIYRALVRGGLGSDPEVQGKINRVRDAAAARIQEVLQIQSLSPLTSLACTGWVSFVEISTADWLVRGAPQRDQLIDLFIHAFESIIWTLEKDS